MTDHPNYAFGQTQAKAEKTFDAKLDKLGRSLNGKKYVLLQRKICNPYTDQAWRKDPDGKVWPWAIWGTVRAE